MVDGCCFFILLILLFGFMLFNDFYQYNDNRGQRRQAGNAAAQCGNMERLSSRHFFLPGAEELLSALHGRYTLCLASNGTGWVQEGRLKNSGILPLLDQVFISEYLGANKPQLGFFDACFASLPGVKRSESLMLGDSLTSDMLGGKIAGMHTCWYNPNRLPLPTDGTVEYQIHRLPDLLPLLEKL